MMPCNCLERARTPLLSSPVHRSRIAGRLVELLNDEVFAPLRAAHDVPEQFLDNKERGLDWV